MSGSGVKQGVKRFVSNPEELTRVYPEAFNSGDVEAVVALYEAEASLVVQPGQVAIGTEAIREVLRGFLGLKPKLVVDRPTVVPAGDLALICYPWRLAGTAADGSTVEIGGNAADILRRQADQSWLIVVDNPFASA